MIQSIPLNLNKPNPRGRGNLESHAIAIGKRPGLIEPLSTIADI